jgi:peptide chain release factor subunit 1
MGKAASIKDKNNRISVVDAQNSARERLKNYQKAPRNGLILFSGKIQEEGYKN